MNFYIYDVAIGDDRAYRGAYTTEADRDKVALADFNERLVKDHEVWARYGTTEAETTEAALENVLLSDFVLTRTFHSDACHCNASTARDGHLHEPDGSVLCLHYDDEDGRDCKQR